MKKENIRESVTEREETISVGECSLIITRMPECGVSVVVKAKDPFPSKSKYVAIRELSKNLSIPGFRKGKIPHYIMQSKYPNEVYMEWKDRFVNSAFSIVQTIPTLHLLNRDARSLSVICDKLDDSYGEVKFTFECEPNLPKIDFSTFTINEVKESDITDEDIDKALENVCSYYATWTQISDRAVMEGDFVTLDIDDMESDPPIQAFSNARFQMNDDKASKWMKDLVIGKKVGDLVEGVSKPDENASKEVKSTFKSKKVRLYIRAIENCHLPELDDNLSKQVGASDLIDLREKMKRILTKDRKEKAQQSRRDDLAKQIINKVRFDIPKSILEKESNQRMQNLLNNRTFSIEWHKKMSAEEKEFKKKEIVAQSREAIILFYVSRQIVADNNIKVDIEETVGETSTLLEIMFANPNYAHYENKSEEQRSIMMSRLMISKAQDFIIEKISKQRHP